MGERSQIFIRYRVYKTQHSKTPTAQGFYAVHHQWSFGERMISRCRGIIEHLLYMGEHSYQFTDKPSLSILRQTIDTNWDMRSIVDSTDLVKEWLDYCVKNPKAKPKVFNTDTNHGHIYVDINVYENKDTCSVKYCFTNYPGSDDNVMDVESFANCDIGNNNSWREDSEPIKTWAETMKEDREDEDTIQYTQNNIDFIKEHSIPMTPEEKMNFEKWGDKWMRKLIINKL